MGQPAVAGGSMALGLLVAPCPPAAAPLHLSPRGLCMKSLPSPGALGGEPSLMASLMQFIHLKYIYISIERLSPQSCRSSRDNPATR